MDVHSCPSSLPKNDDDVSEFFSKTLTMRSIYLYNNFFFAKAKNTYKSIKKRQESEHTLPELTFVKVYRIFCVSIIELPINYNISFKEAVQQLKAKKYV